MGCCLPLGKPDEARQKFFPSPLSQGLAQLSSSPKEQQKFTAPENSNFLRSCFSVDFFFAIV